MSIRYGFGCFAELVCIVYTRRKSFTLYWNQTTILLSPIPCPGHYTDCSIPALVYWSTVRCWVSEFNGAVTAVLKLLCQISWCYVYRVCGAIEIPEKSGPSRLTKTKQAVTVLEASYRYSVRGRSSQSGKRFRARIFFASVVMPSISPDLMDKEVGRHKTNARTTY
jgi:hypothetical protein